GAPGAITPARENPVGAAIATSCVASRLPCQLMYVVGRWSGSEQALPLVFVIDTPPNIVCVAPWKKAEPESWLDRHSGALARPPSAGGCERSLGLAPPMKA